MNQLFKFRLFSLFLMASLFLKVAGMPVAVRAAGTVSLTSAATYTENFDTLASSGTSSTVPNGWYFSEAGGNTTYAAGTGSDNAGNTYSFGATSNAERAFGELTSNSIVTTIGANFSNASGTTIIGLAIGYTGEQWRQGASDADQMDFQYSTDATSLTTGTWTDVNSLDFISPITSGNNDALDGNASANRTALSAAITSLNIANGASFWIRWTAVNVTSNDDGLAVDDFSLTPVLANRAPTDIALSASSVAENQPLNTVVGTFSTTDPDAGNTFAYTLVSGVGDTGNAAFAISGNELRTSAVFDYETQNSYSIRVRSTDQGGLFFEEAFTITVTDVDDAFMDTSVAHFTAGTVGSCIVDNTVGDGALRLNIPSSSTCVFESRIFNAGQGVKWNNLTFTVSTPVDTSVSFETRTGNAVNPEASWTPWQVVNPAIINPGGQYVQYRATLTTADTSRTPVIEQVTLTNALIDFADLIAPSSALTNWDHTFSWTGVNNATWYYLDLYTAGGSFVFRKWYTAAEANCSGDTACAFIPADLMDLSNGDYKWRILDYGDGYGYGGWTFFTNFSLNGACYTLTSTVAPASGGALNNTSQNCTGGYTAGTIVELNVVPGEGYLFIGWSGDAGGTANPVLVTMDGNKNVTADLRGITLNSPADVLTSWDHAFNWTGHANATWYLLQVQTSAGDPVLLKWYTADATGCAGGTACSVLSVETLNVTSGDYKWRVLDYGGYGYGNWTPYTNFTLNAACYTLTMNVSPVGSGAITATDQNCAGGYTAGTVVQVSVAPNAGYVFDSWSGSVSGASNPVSVTMDADKSVTANVPALGVTLISPTGGLTSWDNTFSWTGFSTATWYLVQVQTMDDTVVLQQWYTADQAGCSGGTACAIAPAETLNLANGDYKWRVLDYGGSGYGNWTPYMTFSLAQ